MVPNCGTVQTVLLGAIHSRVLARPAAQQIFSGELQAGGGGGGVAYFGFE